MPQLTAIRTSINSCLDVIDVAAWGGDVTNADFVAGQLQLLHDHILEARSALKGYSDVQLPWWEHPVDDKVGYMVNVDIGVETDSNTDIRASSAFRCIIPPIRLRCCACPRDPHAGNTSRG